jgi:hypothetical protein
MIIERSTQGFSGKSLGLALQLWERKEMDQGVRQLVFIAAAVVTAIARRAPGTASLRWRVEWAVARSRLTRLSLSGVNPVPSAPEETLARCRLDREHAAREDWLLEG